MRLRIAEARSLAERVMIALKHDPGDAALIADHLLDTELRGLDYGGLARALSIVERLSKRDNRQPLRIVRETPVSATIDGGDQIGYIVANHATRIAIDKASAQGIAVVAANNTWYTGMLSYYAEMAAAKGTVHNDRIERVALGRTTRRDGGAVRHESRLLRFPVQ